MKANKFGSKRTKRYDAGGDVEGTKQGIASGFRAEAPGDVPNEGEDGIDAAIRIGTARKNATGDTPKSESFAAAFKRNRAAGEKGFEFNGKKYTTEVKDGNKKSDRLNKLAQDAGSRFARVSNAASNMPAGTSDTAKFALIKAAQDANSEYGIRNAAAGNKMATGGKVKKMATGGKVKSASSRADGCAIRGKTKA